MLHDCLETFIEVECLPLSKRLVITGGCVSLYWLVKLYKADLINFYVIPVADVSAGNTGNTCH